jgi:hypothetical protein
MDESRTDAAALGGGVVAIAMTMFAEPGPYEEVGLAVAIALWLLILGYLGDHKRGFVQSAALAAILSVLSIPIWGYFVEGCPAQSDGCLIPQGVERQSSVDDATTFAVWVIMALLLFLLERSWQTWHERLVIHGRALGGRLPKRLGHYLFGKPEQK